MLEDKTKEKSSEAVHIKLNGWLPPIDKLDGSTSTLTACQQLSLSTNMLERLSNLNSLKNLKILSVGRNYLKSLAGVEACADTLEQIWASYNLIEKPTKGVTQCKKLKALYLANNLIREWGEIAKLSECPLIEDLVVVGNPLEEKFTAAGNGPAEWQREVARRILQLKLLDGSTILRTDDKD